MQVLEPEGHCMAWRTQKQAFVAKLVGSKRFDFENETGLKMVSV
jgi:hypothetical protein